MIQEPTEASVLQALDSISATPDWKVLVEAWLKPALFEQLQQNSGIFPSENTEAPPRLMVVESEKQLYAGHGVAQVLTLLLAAPARAGARLRAMNKPKT